MSLFRIPKFWERSQENKSRLRRGPKSLSRSMFRHPAIDPLEERRLLSLTVMDLDDGLVNEQFGADQITATAKSIAVDHDGDFVVVWTRNDRVEVNPATGEPWEDPRTGITLTDENIYARYFTDEIQQITIPAGLLGDSNSDGNNSAGDTIARFSMVYGGPEIQKITISSAYEPSSYFSSDVSGSFTLGFDLDGDTLIDPITETTGEIYFDESSAYDLLDPNAMAPEVNAMAIEYALWELDLAAGSGTALSDVTVEALNPHEFLIHFGTASLGQAQPELTVESTTFSYLSGFSSSAFLSGVAVSTVRDTTEIGVDLAGNPMIPVSPSNPALTALGIEQAFLMTSEDYPISPVWIGGPYPDLDLMRTAAPEVSVTAVNATTFNITFVGDAGKMDHPELVVTQAYADWDTGFTSNLLASPQYAETLKQSSPEFRVNPEEPDNPFTFIPDKFNQTNPAVAMDGDGEFVIVWESEVPDSENYGSVTDIFARQFSPVGMVAPADVSLYVDMDRDGFNETPIQGVRALPISDESNVVRVDEPTLTTFRVNEVTANRQGAPAVGMDDAGNFVFAWAGAGQDISYFNNISARRFDRESVSLGLEFLVNTEITDINFAPYVGVSGDGHFAVAWSTTSDPNYIDGDVFLATVDAEVYDPQGDPVMEQFNVGGAGYPSIAFDDDNNFVISWHQLGDSDLNGLMDSSGVRAMMFEMLDETQELTITPTDPAVPIGGRFRLEIEGILTTEIIFNGSNPDAAADKIQEAIREMGYDGATVVVIDPGPDTYVFEITFGGIAAGRNFEDSIYPESNTLTLDASGEVESTQDGGVNEDRIREEFRVNSQSFDPNSPVYWPGHQYYGQAALDADGDLIVSYQGAGPDTSTMMSTMTDTITISGEVQQLTITANDPTVPLEGTFVLDVWGRDLWGSPTLIPTDPIDFSGPIILDGTDPDAVYVVASEIQEALWEIGFDGVTVAVADSGLGFLGTCVFEIAFRDTLPSVDVNPVAYAAANSATLAATGTVLEVASTYYSPIFLPDLMYGSGVDVDAAIETVLIGAWQVGATYEQLGQLNATLEKAAGPLRGEVNGVMFSAWDAGPEPYDLNLLSSDNVVNAFRDGRNSRFLFSLDPRTYASSFTLELWHPQIVGSSEVTAPIDFAVIQAGDYLYPDIDQTLLNIDSALEALLRTGNGWPWPFYDPPSGPVSVRLVDPYEPQYELQYRANSPWDFSAVTFAGANLENPGQSLRLPVPDPLVFPEYVFEITFQGPVHDIDMFVALRDTSLKLPPVSEVQEIVFTPNETGETDLFTLGIMPNPNATPYAEQGPLADNAFSADIRFDAADLGGTAARIATAIREIGGYNDVVVTSSVTGDQYVFEVTFMGNGDGADIRTMEFKETAEGGGGGTNPNAFNYDVAFNAVTDGDFRDAFSPRYYQYSTGYSGTYQGLASIGMEPDGDFVMAWTQLDESTSGGLANNSIFYRRFNETTDTAGPTISDLIGPDGIRIVDGGVATFPDGLQQLVVVFDEEMLVKPDVATQLALLGIDPADASEAVIIDAQTIYQDSVTNPENYNISFNDSVLPGAVAEVRFGMNMGAELISGYLPTNKWEAVLTLDSDSVKAGNQPLHHGEYSIEVFSPTSAREAKSDHSGVRDKSGNPLRHTGFAPGGQDYLRDFEIGEPGPETPGPPRPGTVYEPVNTTLIGKQNDPAVAIDADGDYVAVWVSYGQDGDLPGDGNIMGQRFDRTSVPLGEEFIVNSYEIGNQIDPSVEMDDSGNFVVAWSGEGKDDLSGIFARRFDDRGRSQGGDYIINQFTTNIQNMPSVAMDADGDFVIAWTSYNQGGDSDGVVIARRFNWFGQALGNEVVVNTTVVNRQEKPDVAMDDNGNFVVVWGSEGQDGSSWGVYGQRFSSSGSRRGGEFRVNTHTRDRQIDPRVSMDADGDFVVTWASYNQDGSGYGIYARRFNAAGAAQGGEFRVNQHTQNWQITPDVGMDKNGNFSITWSTFNQDDPTSRDYGIYARMYLANGSDFFLDPANPGVALGEFRVNAATAGNQVTPAIARDTNNGDYAVVWAGPDYNGSGVYLRLLDPPVGAADEPDLPAEQPPQSDPTTLDLIGTAGNDVLEVVVGDTSGAWLVRLNGIVQTTLSQLSTLSFDGLGGYDTVTVIGTDDDETAELWSDHGLLEGDDYEVTSVNVESITIHGGKGSDTAVFHDTSGDDTFVASPISASLVGPGTSLTASRFEKVTAYSENGGTDTAELHDSTESDTFVATRTEATLFGNTFYNQAKGFDAVHAYATAGGTDTAKLFDSPDNDNFVATPELSVLYGDGYHNSAENFAEVYGYATVGGNDTAKLFDSSGNDELVATPVYATLSGDGFLVKAKNFESMHAYATGGGNDVAHLFDSSGNDEFVGTAEYGLLSGDGFYNRAKNFNVVHAYSDAGGDDVAQLFDSGGDDTFVATTSSGAMIGDGFYNRAKNFETVNAFAENGGYDQATMYDSPGDDTYVATPVYGALFGDGFYYRAKYFDSVLAVAAAGGNDVAELYDSTGNDTFTASATGATLRGDNFSNRAEGFAVSAHADAGGNDRALLHGAAIEEGFNERPDELFAAIAWLYNFEEILQSSDDGEEETLEAVDAILTAYWQ